VSDNELKEFIIKTKYLSVTKDIIGVSNKLLDILYEENQNSVPALYILLIDCVLNKSNISELPSKEHAIKLKWNTHKFNTACNVLNRFNIIKSEFIRDTSGKIKKHSRIFLLNESTENIDTFYYPENTNFITNGKFVYFVEGNKLIKIGKTWNLKKRMCSLNSASPIELKLIGYCETKYPDNLEQYLHKLFEDYRIRGEWFNLTKEDIYNIIQKELIHNSNIGYSPDEEGDYFEIKKSIKGIIWKI
jgi:hypothetical protein